MCQKNNHYVLPFRAGDLLKIRDRVEGEQIARLSDDFVLNTGKMCEMSGASFSLFCNDRIIACGGMRLLEKGDAWLIWTLVSQLAETHKMILHKAMSGLLPWLLRGSKGIPVLCTINESVGRNVKYAEQLGFKRCGKAEMVAPIGDVQGLYVWRGEDECSS